MSNMRQRKALCDKFEALLCETAKDRGNRQNLVTGPNGWAEAEWEAHERAVMTAAINAELATVRLPAVVTEERVYRDAETEAMGHVDYVHKYALHCAFIVESAIREEIDRRAAECE